MTIWTWIFGVGFLAAAILLIANGIFRLNHKKHIQYRIFYGASMLVGIAIPVLASPFVSDDRFFFILIINSILCGAAFYVSAIFYLKHLNLHIWEIPYDDERMMVKLETQKNAAQQVVFGAPIFLLFIAGIVIFQMMTD